MERIRDGLLRNVDCNVVLVDWFRGSFPPYLQAAGNTRLVGAMIAELIKFLISQTQSSPDLYHVIGFSLGSHIAGYAGSRLNQDGLIVGRITGNYHSRHRTQFLVALDLHSQTETFNGLFNRAFQSLQTCFLPNLSLH